MEMLSGIGVLDKAMQILHALSGGCADLSQLCERTGLPRATAHRLATGLATHGVVRRDPSGRYCLGFELARMGRVALEQFPLAELAMPVLERLRAETGEGVQLYVPEGDGRRCVISLASSHGLRWIVAEGALLPMDRGSAGKVLSGVAPLADSVAEREAGVASVSAAVVSGAHTVAAVCVSGPIERLGRTPRQRFGDEVAAAAAQVSALLPS